MSRMVRWKLRDTLTGEVRSGETTGSGYDAERAAELCCWHWEEGNYSCDCARAQFFAESKGEPDPNIPCGDGRFELVGLWLDGERLVGDEAAP